MKDWFESFEKSLRGDAASSDLIGAGTSSADKAMAHYRYQHDTKIRQSVEDTFVKLVNYLDHDWEKVWGSFRSTNPKSPRSLDWYPQVFLDYYIQSDAASHLKQLARFEHAMDIHPWTHPKLSVISLAQMTSESCLILTHLDLHHFKAPVLPLYLKQSPTDLEEHQTVLFWMMEDGVHFRVMQEWELKVLKNVSHGIEEALEYAPQETEAVSSFFKWLGESGLIRQVLD